MHAISNFIANKFSFIMISALFVGLYFESAPSLIKPYTAFPLMVAIFLGFIKVDFEIAKEELKNPFKQLSILLFTNFILPILIWCVTTIIITLFQFDSQISIAALILYASPTAALVPALTMLLKANTERATISLVLSSLSIPFSLPILLSIFASEHSNIEFITIGIALFKIVIMPFIFAIISRLLFKRATNAIKPYAASLSVVMIFFVIVGCLDGMQAQILSNIKNTIICLAVSFALMLIAFTMGWFSAFKAHQKDHFTLAILAAWPNIGLAILIASNHFASSFPLVLLFVVASEVPWNVAFLFVQRFAKKITSHQETDTI